MLMLFRALFIGIFYADTSYWSHKIYSACFQTVRIFRYRHHPNIAGRQLKKHFSLDVIYMQGHDQGASHGPTKSRAYLLVDCP